MPLRGMTTLQGPASGVRSGERLGVNALWWRGIQLLFGVRQIFYRTVRGFPAQLPGPRAAYPLPEHPYEQLPEPLSEAEVRVLSFLQTSLSAPEIARELCASVNTVRTHTQHLYDKLGAHRRLQAIDRARAVGLLAPALQRALAVVTAVCR